ncbi:amino acid adenylation domain-containing protein [Paenibacillus sp. SYP-B3998]|uniref:Amino acid adenylation domain-containing protein n=1 Tax=Paenibacillus sp. SYP-B3998 TaxID=2678564 RepID=A0A6G4A4S2_9BACL|nr:non-ribosomal peptide synthetase [Paenibacillus sp. SYP-B3998]NEW09288.1 amino acid adenylation domain-containing protein [Paenibacillus sp. SYP-B3998]
MSSQHKLSHVLFVLIENGIGSVKVVNTLTKENGTYPLSHSQKRIWYTMLMNPGTGIANLGGCIKIKSRSVDMSLLERSMTIAVSEHDALRLRLIGDEEDEPRQYVTSESGVPFQMIDFSENGQAQSADGWINEDMEVPFAWSDSPLLRATAFIIDESETWLFIKVHHIIADGMTMYRLGNTVVEIYADLSSGKERTPCVQPSFVSFIEREQQYLQSSRSSKDRNFWLKQFETMPEFTLREHKKSRSHASREILEIPPELQVRMQEFCKEHQIGTFTLFLAAFYCYLLKVTSCRDLVLGTYYTNRITKSEKSMLGMMVSSLPLRMQLDPEQSFASFVKEIGKQKMLALRHQKYPFDLLVQELRAGHAEVDRLTTAAVIDYHPFTWICRNEVTYEIEIFFSKHEINELFLNIKERMDTGELTLQADYRLDAYSQEDAKGLLRHLLTLADCLISSPNDPIRSHEMLDDEEKTQLLSVFNDTFRKYDKEVTIQELFEAQADRWPDRHAIIYNDRAWSYRQLEERANRLASILRERCGIKPDDPVAICLHGSAEGLAAMLGVLKAGGAYVPIDPDTPNDRIKSIVEDSGSRVVISSITYAERMEKLQWDCSGFRTLIYADGNKDEAVKSINVRQQVELEKQLWESVGIEALDEIEAGGWSNSYNGEAFSKLEMEEYAGNVVEKLVPYLHRDTRILELGCSSGLTLFQLAPLVGRYYATDFSEVVIEQNRKRLLEAGYDHVVLDCLPAHEVHRIGETFDVIVINSVVQYFHGFPYLRHVIDAAVELLTEGGVLFVGDVMDLEKKPLLAQSLAEFKRAHPEAKTKTDLSGELFIPRQFFCNLPSWNGLISSVDITDKRFSVENELTRYRYDVLLTINHRFSEEVRPQPVKELFGIRDMEGYSSARPFVSNHAGHLAYIIYTSGSTGKPKGVMIEHRGVHNFIVAMGDLIPFELYANVLCVTSVSFDIFVLETLLPLTKGLCIVIANEDEQKDPLLLHALIERQSVELIQTTPSRMKLLVSLGGDLPGLRQAKALCIGGEPFPEKLLSELRKRSTAHIYNMYGPTETTVWSTVQQLSEGEQIRIGKPVANTQVYVVNEWMQLQPIGVQGELCISGDGVARSYVNREDLTSEKFIAHPFLPGKKLYRTGDLAKWLPDGTLEHAGRMDDQVKLRGYRIELKEIEEQLILLYAVKEAVVTVQELGAGSPELCAYVILNDEMSDRALQEALRLQLPEYMIPAHIVRLDHMPLMLNGKLNRKALPLPGKQGRSVGYEAPRTRLEQELTIVWQDVLGVEQVGITDSFFALGGQSLKAAQLITQVHKRMGTKISFRELFQAGTVKELALRIQGTEHCFFAEIPPAAPQDAYPVSFAQRQQYVQHHVGGGFVHHLPAVLRIEGPLDRERFEAAWRGLVQRHEALRTSFGMEHGELVQRIHTFVDFTVEYKRSHEEDTDRLIAEFMQPFTLERPALLRVKLIHLGERQHLLLFDMHHIISDGVSAEIIKQDLAALYEGTPLPELRLHYKDYAVWQQRWSASEEYGRAATYWADKLSGRLPRLDLPTDLPRPAQRSFKGERVHFVIDADLRLALTDLAAVMDGTMYMVLLAAFSSLLAHCSGQEEMIIGSAAAGRPHSDLDSIVGMFVNTMALHVYPARSKTFMTYMSEIKETALAAYEHQDYPFVELVDKLGLSRDISRNPLFDAMFNMQSANFYEFSFDEAKMTMIELDLSVSQFDLLFNATETQNEVHCYFQFDAALFLKATIERWSDHFLKLLRHVAARPDTPIGRIELLDVDQKRDMLARLIPAPTEFAREQTIHGLFEAQTAYAPERIAVVCCGRELTYRELNERADRLAQYLRAKGVGKDCIVGVMLNRSENLIISILAVLKAGGAYLPLDPDYPADRLRYMLQDSGSLLLLVDEASTGSIPFGGETINVQNFPIPRYPQVPNVSYEYASESLAYVIYTSGSTGKPKGVMLEHRSVHNFIIGMQHSVPFSEYESILALTSVSFDIFVLETLLPLSFGMKVVLASDEELREPDLIHGLIVRENVHMVQSTPSRMQMLLHGERAAAAWSVLQVVMIGGEALPPSLLEHIKEMTSARLFNMYGPTETTVWSTVAELTKAQSVTIGMPIANTRLYILQDSCMLAPMGIVGELFIAGEGLARGYLNRPELTAERFVVDPFVPGERMYWTGDLARWLPDGRIAYAGRIDHQVKIRGYRIELGEIEVQLRRMPMVNDAVVIAREDTEGSSQLCAYIIASEAFTVSDLRTTLATMLPGYMIPAHFVQLAELPLTPSGKLDRLALPKPDGSAALGVDYVTPQTERERLLAAVWEDVLGVPRVGVFDSFFDLGGDSIKALQALSRMHRHGYGLELNELFMRPTIQALAEALTHREMEAEQGAVEGEAPLTPNQAWFLEQGLAEAGRFNQSVMLYHQNGFNEASVRETFLRLTGHHDALRLVFRQEGDRWGQRSRGLTEGEAFGLKVLDFRPYADWAARISETEQLIQDAMRLEEGPLVQLGLFRTAEGDHLLITVHPLVIDEASWRILLEDFEHMYGQYEAGSIADGLAEARLGELSEPALSAKTTSYRECALRLTEAAQRPRLKEERQYWQRIEQAEVSSLPKDFEVTEVETNESCLGNGRTSYGETVSVTLSQAKTKQLFREANRAYRTETSELLLTALALTVRDWTGSGRVRLELERCGRDALPEGVDATRTVGRFTTLYPVLLELVGDEAVSEGTLGIEAKPAPDETLFYAPIEEDKALALHVKTVKDELRRVLDKGASYGILNDLKQQEEGQKKAHRLHTDMLFRWSGSLSPWSETLSEAEEQVAAGSVHAKLAGLRTEIRTRSEAYGTHSLEWNFQLKDARLECHLTYDGRAYRKETANRLITQFALCLERIINHCVSRKETESTTTDFSDRELTSDELAIIAGALNVL